jgi:hypothetical protein
MWATKEGGPVGKAVFWVVLGAVVLVIVGMVVASLVGTLLKLAFYLLVGAAVVGGGLYLLGRARGAIRRGGRFKELP